MDSLQIATALYNDITNGTVSQTAAYQSGPALTGNVKRGAGSAWTITGTHNPGIVNTPSINTIAESVFYAMKMADPTVTLDVSQVKTWFQNKYGAKTDTDKITLANINERLNNNIGLTSLFNAIKINGARVDYNDNWADPSLWNINVSSTDQSVDHTVGQVPYSVWDHDEYVWDTTDPDIANAIVMWVVAQKGIIVVSEENASSKDYLINMLNAGEAVFTTFDPSNANTILSMTPAEIFAMTDEEYNRAMGIKNVSVATELSVQEVVDEEGLMDAESKYEADMAEINKKDAKYDAELSALRTERTAITHKINTVKKVAQENVDRTFKLFS